MAITTMHNVSPPAMVVYSVWKEIVDRYVVKPAMAVVAPRAGYPGPLMTAIKEDYADAR